ncbi:hypothetical protein D3C87_1873660 [compost metagenome]
MRLQRHLVRPDEAVVVTDDRTLVNLSGREQPVGLACEPSAEQLTRPRRLERADDPAVAEYVVVFAGPLPPVGVSEY